MRSFNCVVVQHVPFEGPGRIGKWMADRGHAVKEIHLYRGEKLPSIEDVDWAVLMGGPMSVNDTAVYDWLEEEILWTRRLIDSRRKLLGVCLGAQIIARALGSRVYPAREKEIGWFPVFVHSAVPVALPESLEVLHWHGETFDLPPGAVRWASSATCPNQAFCYGKRVLGLQFHLESTPDSIAALVENGASEIGQGRYQMSPRQILEGADKYLLRESHLHLDALLAYLEGQPVE
ncbi:MAG: type 1 glutamine amidotransferase [Spirochaetaceae bacterium]